MRYLITLCLFLSTLCHSNERYLVVCVEAHQLDYTSCKSFLTTLVKHPRDHSKDGSFGHVWIILVGDNSTIEGGHSGEIDMAVPCYMDGMMQKVYLHEPNPVKYLWTDRSDGFFQKGSGGHVPTFAAKFSLNCDQYARVYREIKDYPFSSYSLARRQCGTLATVLLTTAGFKIRDREVVPIPRGIFIDGKRYVLWQDPAFSLFSFSAPEKIENELKRLVREGYAEDATAWAKKKYALSFKEKVKSSVAALRAFPRRMYKWVFIQASLQQDGIQEQLQQPPLNASHCRRRQLCR